jgi:Protein of unknown function (DUF2851)
MIKLNLNENFICRIWEEKSYHSGLTTTDGDKVEVIDFGKLNYDAGPDYKNAKVKIGDIIYSGSIEIHRSLKDWNLHNHNRDRKYNDLILQVVFYGNEPEETANNPVVKKSRSVPTIILSEFLSKSIHEIWKDVINNPTQNFKLPCFPGNLNVSNSIKIDWLNKMGKERLKYKSERIKTRLCELSDEVNKKIYWEQALFEFICEALGYSKNKSQFLQLSKRINLSEIKKMKLERLESDSLLFGLSGFLNDLRFRDSYISELKSHWSNHKDILRKEIMDKSEWNFFRLRPPNFPTLRLAYASGLLFEILYKDFFKDIIKMFEESDDVKKALEEKFISVEVSAYWKTHYNFGKETRIGNKIIGTERITDIITNVLLPLVFCYSIEFGKGNLKNRIEYFYHRVKPKSGSNEVTRAMEKQLETKVNFLSVEQGLIHLHNFYCVTGKCNDCEIGKTVFKNETANEPLRIILY